AWQEGHGGRVVQAGVAFCGCLLEDPGGNKGAEATRGDDGALAQPRVLAARREDAASDDAEWVRLGAEPGERRLDAVADLPAELSEGDGAEEQLGRPAWQAPLEHDAHASLQDV